MQRTLRRCWATLVILGVLILTGDARRADAGVGVSPAGIYHGFFQSTMTPGRWGRLEFVITEVANRRWFGMVTMIIPAGASEVRLPFAVDGTLAASGEFTGVGKSPAGKVQFHGQFQFFDGGAAVADATYRFQPPGPPDEPPGPPQDRGTATLLRDFISNPDLMPPNVNGVWDGTYISAGNGGNGILHLDVMQACAVKPIGDIVGGLDAINGFDVLDTSFTGEEVVDKGTSHELTFYFRGSINGDGRFAVIGWDLTGDRFIVTGTYYPPGPSEGQQGASASAMYTLMFANGLTDNGTFTMTQQLVPPDPCRGVIGQGPGN